ncbi:MAG: MobF family relaxase [Actinomycetes bacterium]
MLTLYALRSPSTSYYLANHAEEFPPGAELDAPHWWGRQATALGLEGPTAVQDLEALCAAAVPRSVRLHPRSIRAYDLIFSPPKEVSLLLTGSEQLVVTGIEAHRRGVQAGLSYLEQYAASVVIGHGNDREISPVSGLLVHQSMHAISRSGDPHLHTHCLTANIGHGEDSRFRALDGRGLRAHVPAANALYLSELNFHLANSLKIEPRRLDDQQAAVLKASFSSRGAEVAQMGKYSRPAPRSWAQSDLRRAWDRKLDDLGIHEEQLLGHVVPAMSKYLDEHQFAAHLLGDDRRRSRRHVVEAWATSAKVSRARDVLDCVEQLEPSRGLGIGEAQVYPRPLLAGRRSLARLGPRPLEAQALATWMQRSKVIDRAREPGQKLHAVVAPERAFHDARGRRVQAAPSLPVFERPR